MKNFISTERAQKNGMKEALSAAALVAMLSTAPNATAWIITVDNATDPIKLSFSGRWEWSIEWWGSIVISTFRNWIYERSNGILNAASTYGSSKYDLSFEAQTREWKAITLGIDLTSFIANPTNWWYKVFEQDGSFLTGQVNLDNFTLSTGNWKTATVNVMPQNFNPTTPVPEPETYALMLAGLWAVGLAARGRRKTAGTAKVGDEDTTPTA